MTNEGVLYGIGLGPGDPELVTLRASRLLNQLGHLFAPKADERGESLARSIAAFHVGANVVFHELVYPMTREPSLLEHHWRLAAKPVVTLLASGHDVGFITLGDPLLYSTFSYLMRAVRAELKGVQIEVIPAVTSFCASAAATEFVLAERDSILTIAPAPATREEFSALLGNGGRLVLMKNGKRLPTILKWLAEEGLLERTRLVSRVGLPGQRVLEVLASDADVESLGYLSTLLIELDGRAVS
jgi:precorrin-2/cobalt-factor-2 C20-methyltransferase